MRAGVGHYGPIAHEIARVDLRAPAPALVIVQAGHDDIGAPPRLEQRKVARPAAPAALRRFEQTFGIPVVETYGMTEAASMITANPLDGPRKAGSVAAPDEVLGERPVAYVGTGEDAHGKRGVRHAVGLQSRGNHGDGAA